jgi:geranylgeranyl diphosphate synthase type I
MSNRKNIVLQARALLYEHGQKGLDKAREIMLQEKIPYEPLQETVQYFMASWEDVLHPALLSLSCEAVGGKPEATINVAAALVLLAGGADLHDDIIDQSVVKDSKPTVFGKFSKDLTILAGDALLFRGLYALYGACETLPTKQKQAILELTKQAFFGISSAEAKEASLRGKIDSAEEYFEMIKMKSAVSEATMKIGAILGEGTSEEIEALGHYGKTLGVLFTLRDEFIDVYELDELKNRYEKECLPLPVLLTIKDSKKANLLIKQLSGSITENHVENILDLVIDSKETKNLKKEMRLMVEQENHRLQLTKLHNSAFTLLLKSMIEDL